MKNKYIYIISIVAAIIIQAIKWQHIEISIIASSLALFIGSGITMPDNKKQKLVHFLISAALIIVNFFAWMYIQTHF